MDSINDLIILMLQTSLIFAISYFIYRKYLISVFDPLFFFLITQAFTIKMALIQINVTSYLVNFFLCVFCFTIGFLINNPKAKQIDDSNFTYSSDNLKFINYFNFFSFIIIICVNLFFLSQKGLIILSSDPSISKFSDFDEGGGFGAIRRVNWGLGNLIVVSIFFTYLKTHRKRNLIMLLILFLFSLTSGAKGVVLNYIFLIALVGSFKGAQVTKSFQKINNFKIPILIVGFISAIFILMKGSGDGDSSIEASLIKLGVRFLYFGDAIIYYYEPHTVAHFQKYNFIDFFSYQLNSILGFLRITDYKKPLGNELLVYYINDSQDTGLSIGPNIPYYISGYIFFGKYVSIIYSFIIGAIVGYGRKVFFALDKSKTNLILVIIIIYLNLLITNFPQDTQLLITMLFDTIVFASIPAILSALFCYFSNDIKILA
jgi:hypothetical protein